MTYRYESTSREGFIQQLACNYLPHGFWFYVSGVIPEEKDVCAVDFKLTEKYEICISRQSRARRKVAGSANLHYLRYARFFVLLATHGKHRFFSEELSSIRDVRKSPIKFFGYSIGYKKGGHVKKNGEQHTTPDNKWHARVQIKKEVMIELKAYFLEKATRASSEWLGRELYNLPYEPYAPVRQQLLNLLRLINQKRQAAGLERLSTEVLRYQRKIVKPFGELNSEVVASTTFASALI